MLRSAKPVLLLVIALIVTATSSWLTDRDRIRESRSVPPFEALTVAARGAAYVSQGEPHRLELEAPRSVLEEVETTVENGRLTVRRTARGFLDRLFSGDLFADRDAEAITIRVTMPRVRALDIAADARITGTQPISADHLSLGVRGMGDVDLDVASRVLETNVAGAGTLHLRGQTERHDVHISGVGTLRAEALESRRVHVEISGSGKCHVHAGRALDVSISGHGDVRYRGTPQISEHIPGSGSVYPF